MSWRELTATQQQIIIILPLLVTWFFVNAKAYQELHNGCHAESEHDIDLSYFQSLGYLQTVAFTIGYGHISPTCHSGQIFTLLFGYITIPFVVYILALAGRLIVEEITNFEDKYFKRIRRKPLRNLVITALLDLFIMVVFIVIPAGIVKALEPCFDYGESMWYLFQTITTIGFGDVIARSGYCENEDYEGQDLDNITNAVYWVGKMFFLLIALSFMAASWIKKYELMLRCIHNTFEKRSHRPSLHLIGSEATRNDIE